jgi:hypothetical protein
MLRLHYGPTSGADVGAGQNEKDDMAAKGLDICPIGDA